MGGNGDGFSGTCIKNTWTKPNGDRIEDGEQGWLGWGEWWRVNGGNRS